MAALSDWHPEPVVELRRIAAEQLSPILEEETSAWRAELDWDFRPSADLVRRFVHMQALSGFALLHGSRVVGYSYYVCEEGKGLLGDLYVMREHRTAGNENILLQAMLDAMGRTPAIRRVEAQLMMLSSPLDRALPLQSRFRAHPRCFLEAPLGSITNLPARKLPNIVITPWTDARQDPTARLIASAYQGHIDSQINDQYRSPAGARRFLMNIVQYPGCGTFFAPASFAATEGSGRELRGVSLASLVAADVGHITQVCVAPSHKGIGLGYELMRRSLLALAAHGCHMVSLTVTASNESAIRLYEQMGFKNRRNFAAYVWELR
jgi:ribosomal protein S18 acetylase RimI-like enzyme